jgi:5-methylcytosine-specific restriction protein A
MTLAPLRYCSVPRCPEKVRGSGRCSKHQQRPSRQNERRHHSGIPGVNYGRRWRKARLQFLTEHPCCVRCEAEGRFTVATEVHHSDPHLGDYVKFWNESRWVPLCKPHHSAETARETWRR